MSKNTLYGLIVVILSGVGCDSLQQTKRDAQPDPDNQWLNACNGLKAQVAGIDKEISLRTERVWNTKYISQAYGRIGVGLGDEMRKNQEAILQARAKRAEVEYRAEHLLVPAHTQWQCDVAPDTWDDHESKFYSCAKAFRSNTDPSGYVLDVSACPELSRGVPAPQSAAAIPTQAK